MKHLIYTGNYAVNGSIQTERHDLPSLDTVLQQWAEETNYEGSLSDLKIVTMSGAELAYAHENHSHLTDVFHELTDMIGACDITSSLLIITVYPALDLKKALPFDMHEILDEHFHTINNYKQYFNSWGELNK